MKTNHFIALPMTIFMGICMLTAPCSAQKSAGDVKDNPQSASGVYAVYPTPEENHTPAPKGFKPFYISHYGRHGSRYLLSESDYTNVKAEFDEARDKGKLTSLGLSVSDRIDSLAREASGRAGQLSPLGRRQHAAIAARMAKAYPEAFTGPETDVTAVSTTVMRCAHSMFAFIESLKEQFPNLDIPLESSQRNMYYMANNSEQSNKQRSHSSPASISYRKFMDERINSERLVNSLFSDPEYIKDRVDPDEVMWQLYWLAIDQPNMETQAPLFDVFTPEELFALYEVFNYNFYSRAGDYPLAEGAYTDCARNLVANIIENADTYVKEGKNGATLRFGHDSNIVPLMALIKVDGCHPSEADPEKLASVYSGTEVCPMGANIQFIFYRDKKGETLVKILHNEKETLLDLPAYSGPYYRWDDLRQYLGNIAGLANPL